MCEELRADLCQIKNEQKETQNQVYLLEATIRKLREDNFEAEMLQVELKSERDLALEQAKNAQVNTFQRFLYAQSNLNPQACDSSPSSM